MLCFSTMPFSAPVGVLACARLGHVWGMSGACLVQGGSGTAPTPPFLTLSGVDCRFLTTCPETRSLYILNDQTPQIPRQASFLPYLPDSGVQCAKSSLEEFSPCRLPGSEDGPAPAGASLLRSPSTLPGWAGAQGGPREGALRWHTLDAPPHLPRGNFILLSAPALG
jgi:hypothetical protein